MPVTIGVREHPAGSSQLADATVAGDQPISAGSTNLAHIGGALAIGRSRSHQANTDLRNYARRAIIADRERQRERQQVAVQGAAALNWYCPGGKPLIAKLPSAAVVPAALSIPSTRQSALPRARLKVAVSAGGPQLGGGAARLSAALVMRLPLPTISPRTLPPAGVGVGVSSVAGVGVTQIVPQPPGQLPGQNKTSPARHNGGVQTASGVGVSVARVVGVGGAKHRPASELPRSHHSHRSRLPRAPREEPNQDRSWRAAHRCPSLPPWLNNFCFLVNQFLVCYHRADGSTGVSARKGIKDVFYETRVLMGREYTVRRFAARCSAAASTR